MFKPLHEIQMEYARCIAALEENGGELTDEISMALTISKDELEAKAEAYALRILDFLSEEERIKNEIERLKKRADSASKTADKLKGFISGAMEQFGIDKIKSDKVSLSFRSSEVVDVPELWATEAMRFVKVEPMFDQAAFDTECAEALLSEGAEPTHIGLDALKYLKVKVEVDKALMKSDLKAGSVVPGDVKLKKNKNLQIK